MKINKEYRRMMNAKGIKVKYATNSSDLIEGLVAGYCFILILAIIIGAFFAGCHQGKQEAFVSFETEECWIQKPEQVVSCYATQN